MVSLIDACKFMSNVLKAEAEFALEHAVENGLKIKDTEEFSIGFRLGVVEIASFLISEESKETPYEKAVFMSSMSAQEQVDFSKERITSHNEDYSECLKEGYICGFLYGVVRASNEIIGEENGEKEGYKTSSHITH